MLTKFEHIPGIDLPSLGFELKKEGSIYVTEYTPIHYTDEQGSDYFSISFKNSLSLLFRIDHLKLHHFFENELLFSDLAKAAANGVLYFTNNSKSKICTFPQIPKSVINQLNYQHQPDRLTPYGFKLLKLNNICASFNS